jgi:hypothetical protein
VAELGVMLPTEYTTHRLATEEYGCGDFQDFDDTFFFADTMAQAMASMLIDLLIEGKISVAEVNNRLTLQPA